MSISISEMGIYYKKANRIAKAYHVNSMAYAEEQDSDYLDNMLDAVGDAKSMLRGMKVADRRAWLADFADSVFAGKRQEMLNAAGEPGSKKYQAVEQQIDASFTRQLDWLTEKATGAELIDAGAKLITSGKELPEYTPKVSPHAQAKQVFEVDQEKIIQYLSRTYTSDGSRFVNRGQCLDAHELQIVQTLLYINQPKPAVTKLLNSKGYVWKFDDLGVTVVLYSAKVDWQTTRRMFNMALEKDAEAAHAEFVGLRYMTEVPSDRQRFIAVFTSD